MAINLNYTKELANANEGLAALTNTNLRAAMVGEGIGVVDNSDTIDSIIMRYTNMAMDELNSLLATIDGMQITDGFSFTQTMYGYMARLMAINYYTQHARLNNLGLNIAPNGDGDNFSIQNIVNPFVLDTNYLDFAKNRKADDLRGVNTTRNTDGLSANRTDYTGIKGIDIYGATHNLYPDDLGQGTNNFGDEDKWVTGNDKRSILYKMRKYFHERKINTMISRFASKADNGSNDVVDAGDARSKYGISHGRNLLTKQAEDGTPYSINGYNNPYCRVWTHHHQYDNYSKLIRPFVRNGEDGIGHAVGLQDIHKWSRFQEKVSKGEQEPTYSWKGGVAVDGQWEKSVLDKDTTMPQFAPMHSIVKQGEESEEWESVKANVSKCMLSIENLAWKDMNKYDFEKCLAPSQVGPHDGRIMWFPPYGLSFNETTTPEWVTNTFIGRGEPVKTYKQTTRTGTLRFTMICDYPSIVDYVIHGGVSPKADENVTMPKDTDWLRYFAGCDVDGVVEKAARPFKDTIIKSATPNGTTNDNKPTKKESDEIVSRNALENGDGDGEKVVFYVFFPNNYSGCYDWVRDDATEKNTDMSNVNSISYLLYGNGAQKDNSKITVNANNEIDTSGENWKAVSRDSDIPLNFESQPNSPEVGLGYEMSPLPITESGYDANNFIYGYRINALDWPEDNMNKNYIQDIEKKYGYRIDGRYKVEKSSRAVDSDGIKNTYVQRLTVKDNYKDRKSFRLNNNAEKVRSLFGIDKQTKVYSFAEIAYTLLKKKRGVSCGACQILNESMTPQTDALAELESIFNLPLMGIKMDGYASAAQYNPSDELNRTRNESLATNRVNTIHKFINYCLDTSIPNTFTFNPVEHVQGQKEQMKDVSNEESKKWRSVRCELTFKTTAVKDDKNSESAEETEQNVRKTTTEKNPQVESAEGAVPPTNNNSENIIRYDDEYYFFKKLVETDPITTAKLQDKLAYFTPAFHSMSPEGFNARLTFLQQCTRQGSTLTTSDSKSIAAGNLAFGRPPYCVLRIGDFFNTLITIDNLSIEYDSSGITWDLNPEGIGVQPMFCYITMNITILGGMDISGPVRRLQNAVSFNYYANASLYDNRAYESLKKEDES